MDHIDAHSSPTFLRKRTLRSAISLLAVCMAPCLWAVDYTWTGAVSSTWSAAANWSPSTGVPGPADNVIVPNTDRVLLLDADHTVKDLTVDSGRVDLNGRTLTYTGTGLFDGAGIDNGTLAPNSAAGLTSFLDSKFNASILGSTNGVLFRASRFNAPVKVTKTGFDDDISQGGNFFNASLELVIAGDGEVRMGENSVDHYNGNLLLNCTSDGGIRFGYGLGGGILAEPFAVSIGSTGFTSGTLSFVRFTQQGGTPQVLDLGIGAALGFHLASVFNGPVTSTSGQLTFSSATFNAGGSFTKTGPSEDISSGNCTFNGPTAFILAGSGSLRLADLAGDTYNADLRVSNTGNGDIRFGTEGGACTLAAGATVAVGDAGFTNGALHLAHFTQLGSTAQTLSLATTAALHLEQGDVFNGAIACTAGQLYVAGSTFNGASSFTKTADGANACAGGNTFNGAVDLHNTSAGDLRLAATDGDVFNGDASFMRTGAGELVIGQGSDVHFRKNVSTVGSTGAVLFGPSAASPARTVFDGSTPQQFTTDVAAYPPSIRNLSIATTGDGGLDLLGNVEVVQDVAFTTGVIRTHASTSTANGLLVLGDDVSVSDPADAGSYVEGFVRKNGNDAFTFPVGDQGIYAPIAIGAPATSTDGFTARYIHQDPAALGNTAQHDATLDRISGCEYWALDRTSGSSAVSVTLSYDAARSCGMANPSRLAVAGWNGSLWKDHGDGGVAGVPAAGTVTSAHAISSFARFTLASSVIAPDPIDVIDFTAANAGPAVVTEWHVITELASDRFEVERSGDGRSFEHVGTLMDAGNGRSARHYTLFDQQPLRGRSYYRLKLVAVDGSSTYSEVASVYNDASVSQASVFPNPTMGEATVVLRNLQEGALTLTVMDAQGRQVHDASRTVAAGDLNVALSLDGLPAGMYLVRVSQADGQANEMRLVKQ